MRVFKHNAVFGRVAGLRDAQHGINAFACGASANCLCVCVPVIKWTYSKRGNENALCAFDNNPFCECATVGHIRIVMNDA